MVTKQGGKMAYSEKYGQSVDEAVRLALEELQLTEDQVMVTVLEEPTKGFFSIGQKLAKVRVEKIEGLEDSSDPTQAEVLEAMENSKATHDFRKKKKPEGQGGQGERSSEGGEKRSQRRSDSRGPRNDRNDRKQGGGRGRNEEGGRGRNGQGREKENNYPEIEIDISGKQSISEPIENLVSAPDSKAALFLADVIKKMNLDVETEGFANDECYYIEVKGEDARMVIGKRGQTLDSLQYLTNLVTNKDQEVYKRVVIDVEGYRSRREKTLEQLAVKMAKKALRSDREVRLEPMNPYERKVIHSTLQAVDGLSTRSEGEEPYRRVIIEKK
jgi:spoIIIJ-associated protein